MTMTRRLTLAQLSRLDRLADDHPEAKVVGWKDERGIGGPIISYRGSHRFLNNHGRLVAHRMAVAA